MVVIDLKVVIATDYLLLALPAIEKAVSENNGEIVGTESEVNPISINRGIKRLEANLLILAISGDSICKLIKDVKKKHPHVFIITIARELKQIPTLIKTRMVQAILFVNEDTNQLSQAIKDVTRGKKYYSPKVSSKMAKEIATGNLTPREKQILDLRDDNRSRNEIALILKISYNTVSTHIRNINQKNPYLMP